MSGKIQSFSEFLQSIEMNPKVAIKCFYIGITAGVIIGIIYFVNRS